MTNWDTEWLVFCTEEFKKNIKNVSFSYWLTLSLNVSLFFKMSLQPQGFLCDNGQDKKNHCVSEPHFVEVLEKKIMQNESFPN